MVEDPAAARGKREAAQHMSPPLSSHPWDGQIPQANTDASRLSAALMIKKKSPAQAVPLAVAADLATARKMITANHAKYEQ